MRNYSYLAEWRAAIERTRRLGLEVPECRLQPEKRYLTPRFIQEFPYIIKKEVGIIEDSEIIAQCMNFHLMIIPVIQDYLKCSAIFTIGWIDIDHKHYLYKFDESFIENSISNNMTKEYINIHAWITLESMEIIDATLPTTIAKIQNTQKGYGEVIMQHCESPNKLFYMPMLVGDDYLVKSGIKLLF